MFTQFFYTLKNNGLDISTTEWLTLMEGLDKGLAHSNFTDFYYLCKTVLVKSEADYDKLDSAFLEYFKNIKTDKLNMEKLNKWLHNDQNKIQMTNPEDFVDKRTERVAQRLEKMVM